MASTNPASRIVSTQTLFYMPTLWNVVLATLGALLFIPSFAKRTETVPSAPKSDWIEDEWSGGQAKYYDWFYTRT
jgi:hypothetical protein